MQVFFVSHLKSCFEYVQVNGLLGLKNIHTSIDYGSWQGNTFRFSIEIIFLYKVFVLQSNVSNNNNYVLIPKKNIIKNKNSIVKKKYY